MTFRRRARLPVHLDADHPPSLEEYLDVMVNAAREHLPSAARILIEPGRSMVAPSAVTVYRVTTVKHGPKTFVAVDGGGMGDNLEVALVGQRFEASIVNRVGGGETVTVVGRHCESGDVISDGVQLREPRVGDLLAVPVTRRVLLHDVEQLQRRPPDTRLCSPTAGTRGSSSAGRLGTTY